MSHLHRIQGVFQFGLGHEAFFQDQIIHRLARGGRLLGDKRGLVVAEVGHEHGDNARRLPHQLEATFAVGGDADDAAILQNARGPQEHVHGLKEVEGDDGLKDVQFELSGLGGHGHGQVVADGLEADLIDHFRDDRIDLAGHDGRARLHGRQIDLVQPGVGSGRQQAKIVADLGQFDRDPLEYAGKLDKGPGIGRGLDQIGRLDQRQTRDLGQHLADKGGVGRHGVDARTDGRGPHVDFHQKLAAFLQAVHVLAHGHGPGRKLLAQSHGHGVLELGAAHLEDIGELLTLGGQSPDQLVHGLNHFADLPNSRDAQRGRIDVVGRLGQIDVIVGMAEPVLALGVPHKFEGAVGDDLVGVHVDRCAGPALNDIDHELIVQVAIAHLAAGGHDGLRDVRVEQAQFEVGQGRSLLDARQSLDVQGIVGNRNARDLKILHGPYGLHPVIGRCRHLALTQRILLHPVAHIHSPLRKIVHRPTLLQFH